jgi:hypothetical protein
MNHIAALHQITMAKCDAEVQLDLRMTFIVYGNDPAMPRQRIKNILIAHFPARPDALKGCKKSDAALQRCEPWLVQSGSKLLNLCSC